MPKSKSRGLKPFSAYTESGCLQLRDQNGNIVAVMPTIGGGYSTDQTHRQARIRLGKIVRTLNGSPFLI